MSKNEVAINIGGRTIPLLFNLGAWIRMEEEVCVLARVDEILTYDREKKTNSNLRDVIALVRVLGNEGLKQAGEEADLTDEWLIEHIRPAQVLPVKTAIKGVMAMGFASETNKPDPKAPRDLELEEINKKKQENHDPEDVPELRADQRDQLQ